MSAPVIAFFNDRAGVGKTTLVYHLAWMFSDLGARVLAADLDPQAHLSGACLDDEELESLQDEGRHGSVYGCVQPLLRGGRDIAPPVPVTVSDFFALLAGGLRLSALEEELSSQWLHALSGNERAFLVLSAFWRVMQKAAVRHEAELILADLGPNLGAINRAALIAADYVIVPLYPDLFSLQGLRNSGLALARWRKDWNDRLERAPKIGLDLPSARMEPLGYIAVQPNIRFDLPLKAYAKWIDRIPGDYRTYVLAEPGSIPIQQDPHKLASLKHYRSLISMAQEARKPMFHLKPADGAMGSHMQLALQAYNDFKALALTIAAKANVMVSSLP